MRNTKGDYNGLRDLTDGKGNKINLSDFAKTTTNNALSTENKDDSKPSLPDTYKGKNWDDLYRSDELETIRTQHPEHYEKLRKEKFRNNY
jgi:hypothetical protein